MTPKLESPLRDQQAQDDEIDAMERMPDMKGLEANLTERSINEQREWVNIVFGMPDGRNVFVFNNARQDFLLAKREGPESSDFEH